MPTFRVETPQRSYDAVVERGVVALAARYIPAGVGKVIVVSEENVWRYRGAAHGLLKERVASVEAPDPQRVVFKLKNPWPDFITFYTVA